MLGGVKTSETGDELADDVSESEPHPESVKASAAAQAANTTEEDTREEFTIVTLQPDYPVVADSPFPHSITEPLRSGGALRSVIEIDAGARRRLPESTRRL
jgi:hypothetical protein